MAIITVGSRVQYAATFLRSIGCYTGPMPFARGTVIELNRIGRSPIIIATVQWDTHIDMPQMVNVANLSIPGKELP